jgi:hypothetical protein
MPRCPISSTALGVRESVENKNKVVGDGCGVLPVESNPDVVPRHEQTPDTPSTRVSALERAELVAADAMTMLNPFLTPLLSAEDDALDALMELDTRTPPGGLVGADATALHML